jgi:hypothetical protein
MDPMGVEIVSVVKLITDFEIDTATGFGGTIVSAVTVVPSAITWREYLSPVAMARSVPE